MELTPHKIAVNNAAAHLGSAAYTIRNLMNEKNKKDLSAKRRREITRETIKLKGEMLDDLYCLRQLYEWITEPVDLNGEKYQNLAEGLESLLTRYDPTNNAKDSPTASETL